MENVSIENKNEKREGDDLLSLSFEELKRLSKDVSELAKISFEEIENGFRNVNGDAITIWEENDRFEIGSISDSLRDFHKYILDADSAVLNKGSNNKEELMQAIRDMIRKFGNRIVE